MPDTGCQEEALASSIQHPASSSEDDRMKSKFHQRLFTLILPMLAMMFSGYTQVVQNANAKVKLLRVPNGGLQPQAVMDERGALHLIYFSGEPGGGDIYYVRRGANGTEFTVPIKVNSEPNTAVATGTIRGAHLAIGKNGRVHVAWNGPHKPGGHEAPSSFAASRGMMKDRSGKSSQAAAEFFIYRVSCTRQVDVFNGGLMERWLH
jgi:hypothetical protein